MSVLNPQPRTVAWAVGAYGSDIINDPVDGVKFQRSVNIGNIIQYAELGFVDDLRRQSGHMKDLRKMRPVFAYGPSRSSFFVSTVSIIYQTYPRLS